MKRSGRNQHGAITVFLSFVMISIIAIMGMLVDLSRMRVAESQVKRASQLALDSVMSEYSRRLREDYGLYGYAGKDANATYQKYLSENLQPAVREEEDSEFLNLLHTIIPSNKVSYGDMLNLSADADETVGEGSKPLSDPDVLFQQVMEFSKFRVPISMALSNTLDTINKMRTGMTQADRDNAAYDRISKLSEPLEEYQGERDVLSGAVDELRAAVKGLNTAAKGWNCFICGADENEKITASHSEPVKAWYLEAVTSILDDKYEYIIDGRRIDLFPIDYGHSISATAYDQSGTSSAFGAFSSDIYDEMMLSVASDFRKQVQAEEDWLIEQDEKYRDSQQEYPPELQTLMEAHNAFISQKYQPLIDEAGQFATGIAEDFADEIASDFLSELASRTKTQYESYTNARKAVESACSQVEDAIKDLEKQGKKVDREVEDISREIDEKYRKQEISEGVNTDWNGDQGDRNQTEALRNTDKQSIDALKQEVEQFKQQMKASEGYGKLDTNGIATSFLNDSVISGAKRWDPYAEHYAIEEAVSFNGAYASREGSEEDHKQKKKEADDRIDEAKKAAENLGKNEKTQEVRYNPDAETIQKYAERFVNREEAQDEDSVTELSTDTKQAKEAQDASERMNSGFGGFTRILEQGLEYILDTVYCSEYMLNMFSYAAPPQSEPKYDPETFEYARVVSLRNAMPVGIEKYKELKDGDAKLRLGYFYNAEVEYILYGCLKEEDNVTRAKLLPELLFTVTNYRQVRRDAGLRGMVEAIADAGMAIGIPSFVTKFVFYLAFAAVETQFEMFYFMRGYGIPIFSANPNHLFMFHDANQILRAGEGAGAQFMLNYELYLRLRLMLGLTTSRDSIMERMANLIQLNINYAADVAREADSGVASYESDADFSVQRVYTTFRGKAAAKMPYWFMTMAMMGGAQSDSKWFAVSPYEIVTSY